MYDIGWTNTGEWLKYTVNVIKAGTYTLQARVASQGSGNHFHVEIDGTNIGTIAVPNTGGNQAWQTSGVTTSSLTIGQHTLRIYLETGGFNLEYLYFFSTPVISSSTTASGTTGSNFLYTITASGNPTSYHATSLPTGLTIDTLTGIITGTPLTTGISTIIISATNGLGTGTQNLALTFNAATIESPFSGTTAYIPGKIIAANYDNGGEGIAYHDNDVANLGGVYRTSEGVDIQNSSEGMYNIGFTNGGEYTKYTVNVTSSGTYTLQARVASSISRGSFHVEMNGINISGSVSVPNTSAAQTYQTVSVTTAPLLVTGIQTMCIVIDSGGFNLEYLNLVLQLHRFV
ncbi:MAG: carbohydrate-binding protein [Ferruginibacter sp.]